MILMQWYWASTEATFLFIGAITECISGVTVESATWAEWCFDHELQFSRLDEDTWLSQSISSLIASSLFLLSKILSIKYVLTGANKTECFLKGNCLKFV